MDSDNLSVGIDLGTTTACIATCRDDVVQIITNIQGDNLTPCFVSFSDTGLPAGDDAKKQMSQDLSNAPFGAERRIGCRDSKSGIRLYHAGETKEVVPRDILTIILRKLKKDADSFLGTDVTKAVIAVPVYFDDAQRQATKDAGKLAGWEVLRVINQSTAAAIAYGLEKVAPVERERSIMVLHLGGGILTISSFLIEEGIFEMTGTVTDRCIGGDVFTERLVDHFASEFERKFDKDLRGDSTALWRLESACEEAKCRLSTEDEIFLEIASLYDGHDFRSSLSQSRFEELNQDLFASILEHFENILSTGRLKKELVEEVVLSGGSTRIPKIREMVSEFFNNRALLKFIPPEEVVAHGAAVQAAILSDDKWIDSCNFCCIFNVVPLSLGVETLGGVMATIVGRHSTMPTRKSEYFTTVADNQTSILLRIHEGQRIRTRDNRFLGQLELSGIPPAARGVPRIEVIFEVDPNGVLIVSAFQRSADLSNMLTVSAENGNLTSEEIERMVLDGEQHQAEDEAFANALRTQMAVECMESTTQEVAVWSGPTEAALLEIEEAH
ncbi:hypothetical protein EMPS_09608 [Entomortierella parvispora]|uniref:Heat shock protein 70 n=1 Tax=Entomortierella parvispora TaxID=205924 RepID=A0A9P3HIB1_9FUNG|nr:hypothetical protein EMPS_09608 [Entomortierella parvispora]